MSGSLFTHGRYERAETKLVSRVVKPGWVVIDAGANFGWNAMHLARLVGPDGRVIAFEPVPESFQELTENVQLNDLAQVEAFNLALGSSGGAISMYVPDISLGAGAASQCLGIGRKIEVPVAALDDFLFRQGCDRVDFVKADIEGGGGLLRGAQGLLARCRPSVLIEVSDIHCRRFGHAPQDVIESLGSRGYVGRFVNGEGRLEGFEPARPPNGNYLFTARPESGPWPTVDGLGTP